LPPCHATGAHFGKTLQQVLLNSMVTADSGEASMVPPPVLPSFGTMPCQDVGDAHAGLAVPQGRHQREPATSGQEVADFTPESFGVLTDQSVRPGSHRDRSFGVLTQGQ